MSLTPPEEFRRRRGGGVPHQTSPRRVHDVLRAAIRSGDLPEGTQLVEWELVQEYATSRNAVREALQLLAREGLVSRHTREGTTVVGGLVKLPLDDLVLGPGTGVAIIRLDERVIPSTAPLRRRLQTDDPTIRFIEHLLTYRDEPIGVWLTYCHVEVEQPLFWDECPDLATAFSLIYKHPLGRVETTVEALPCEPRTMRLLGFEEPITMLVKEHILYDVDGVPRDVSYCQYRSDRVSFSISSTSPSPSEPAATPTFSSSSATRPVPPVTLRENG